MNTSNGSDGTLMSADPAKEELKKLKMRNRREIDMLQKQMADKPGGTQRMCGCEAFCSIF